jgi:transcription elongation factor Elf1
MSYEHVGCCDVAAWLECPRCGISPTSLLGTMGRLAFLSCINCSHLWEVDARSTV